MVKALIWSGKTEMKLAHLAVSTRDLEAVAGLWRTHVDVEVGDRYDSRNRPGFASRFVQIPGPEARKEIMAGPRVPPHSGETCGWAHTAFPVGTTNQVDAVADRFRRDGLLVSAPQRAVMAFLCRHGLT